MPSPTRRALRAAGSLAVLALLAGALLGWQAGTRGREMPAILGITGACVLAGWAFWRGVRRELLAAIAAAGAPSATDVAALDTSVAAHEARLRPNPRPPRAVTISERSDLT